MQLTLQQAIVITISDRLIAHYHTGDAQFKFTNELNVLKSYKYCMHIHIVKP